MRLIPTAKTELDLFALYFLMMYVCIPFVIQFSLTIIGAATSIPLTPLQTSFSYQALNISSLVAGIIVVTKARKLGFVFEYQGARIFWLLAILLPLSIHLLHRFIHWISVAQNHDSFISEFHTSKEMSKLFLSVILAPIFEEFITRGLLFSWFLRKYSLIVSAAFTTLIFMLLHFNIIISSFIESFILLIGSIGLITLRIFSKSLGPCMLMHSLYNFSEILL